MTKKEMLKAAETLQAKGIPGAKCSDCQALKKFTLVARSRRTTICTHCLTVKTVDDDE